MARIPLALSAVADVMSQNVGYQRADAHPGNCGIISFSCSSVMNEVICSTPWSMTSSKGTSYLLYVTFSISKKAWSTISLRFKN